MMLTTHLVTGSLALSFAAAQVPLAVPFSSGFNSSFVLTDAEIKEASLSEEQAPSVNAVLNFERSSHAYGGPRQDDFYTLPSLSETEIANIKPGQILKVQEVTDPAQFAIPAGTALSRILYTTETFNKTIVPASAFILWPFRPRHDAEKAPTVLFAHGTSGIFGDAAPSAHRNLLYDNHLTFHLAQSGYAVVAPDYAGLGIENSWDESFIPHQWLTSPSAANDMLHAMGAALEAFDERLSGQFAVVGHSQGGAVAWSTAELLGVDSDGYQAEGSSLPDVGANESSSFRDLAQGYVGTIAMAPVTRPLTMGPFAIAMMSASTDSIFPDFNLSEWLTPLAISRVKLLKKHQGGATVAQQLFLNEQPEALMQPGWQDSWYAQALPGIVNIGERDFAGPLLVVQGTNDFFVNESITAASIDKVCKRGSESQLEYLVGEGSGHTPIISELRSSWMEWLEARFDGKELDSGCSNRRLSGWLGEANSKTHNSIVQWVGLPEYSYQNLGAI